MTPVHTHTRAAQLLASGYAARLRHRSRLLDLSPAQLASPAARPRQALVWWEGLPTVCTVQSIAVGERLAGVLPVGQRLGGGMRYQWQTRVVEWEDVIGLGGSSWSDPLIV